MAHDQLFYGALSNVTPIASGSNSYVRVRGDYNTASKTIENVSNEGSYLNIDYVRPGQTLVASGPFSAGTVVVSVDTGAATITVADFPATTATNVVTRISPAPGEYYIASASFLDPNTQVPISTKNITGSNDPEYQSSLSPIYTVIGPARVPGGSSPIEGEYHLYNIKEVYYRNGAGTEASFYIGWGEDGTESETGTVLLGTSNQQVGIVAVTPSQSLAPIFSSRLSGL